jgi:hypothetical protein
MKRDPGKRAIKFFLKCVSRWLVVAAFAGIGHASAVASTQKDIKGRHKAMQPQSLDSCPQCAACQLAPSFESSMASHGDLPAHATSSSAIWTRDGPSEVCRHMATSVLLPTVALRFRYCRWLN